MKFSGKAERKDVFIKKEWMAEVYNVCLFVLSSLVKYQGIHLSLEVKICMAFLATSQ